jgi:hypothetical protein
MKPISTWLISDREAVILLVEHLGNPALRLGRFRSPLELLLA